MSRLLALVLLLGCLAALPAAAVYETDVRPLLKRYCLTCHSAAAHAGDLNFERFATMRDVLKNPRPWQKAVEQLSLGEMPPKIAPQPSAEERTRLLDWAKGALDTAARARAGDPGPVVLRRLNNAEYTFTVRDLTGVASLDPAREFPADGAAGEGFMNTGNALAMSPSLVSKYLDAGKAIASHAMLVPSGLRFSGSTSRRDWTDELLGEIRAFYASFTEAGGADTVTQQGIALDKNRGGTLPLKKYLAASLVVRDAPARMTAVARERALSPKYLAALVKLLRAPGPSPVLDPLRKRWRRATEADLDAMVEEIARWQNTLWKFSSVGHIGKVDGPKAWQEPVAPVVNEQEFRFKLAAPAAGNDVLVYLAAHDGGDGSANDQVVWREPRLVIPGRPPVLLRDLPALVSALTSRREQVFGATARALEAASSGGAAADDAMKAWFGFLGVNSQSDFKLDLLTRKIEKTATFDFVRGWGAAAAGSPVNVLANASDQNVRVPGNMRAHGVAVHPSPTHQAAVGWRSPVAATLRVEAALQRAHPECGNGVTWTLELRRGATRQRLAEGEARNAAPVAIGPFDRVRVQPGDLISLLVGPREANHSCDLTGVDLTLSAVGGDRWSLAANVSGNVLSANPHGGLWHFYMEPVAGDGSGSTLLPAGSLLAKWQAAEDAGEKRRLAGDLQRMLTGAPPAANDTRPDAVLYRQLASLAGPLFAQVHVAAALTQSPDLTMRAPAMHEYRLPADLVAGSEFVVTGTLDARAGAEGTVQLEVLADTRPKPGSALLPAGTTVGDAKGTWSSNNQTISYAMPVVVREASAARKRVEAAFDEFRAMFPASLCYTKIVPVDEVVTLTLFHREDEHLSRLILDERQKAKLDRLWDELHFVSRDALTLVDAFEQLWQFATQDADPSKFEPLRQPILARAAAFRKQLADTEPRQVDAVLEFAGRAYRRPLTPAEGTQLRDLYRQLRTQEMNHEDAIRLLLARVLVAPAFLYRTEQTRPGKLATPVSGDELASRLSYFLWSSQPDAELRQAASAGTLRTAAGIQAQARRMLRDQTRTRRLATEFGAAWLHIHGFDSLDEKSERHFPEFRGLRGAMYEEPIRFFTDLFASNGSILSILNAGHTFLNEEMARYYGIPGVNGPEWRRVDGVGKYSRGGVLGQAAVLAKQAGASRTSPILRGNWVAEVLLGDKLPRPPKDVPQLPADEAAESLTVRELTERHTRDPRCSSCHARVDPYGYTLERFDAVGRVREKDLGGRPINDRATLRDGTVVNGAAGLRDYLLTKGRPAFVRQFCRKLLGYALGRAVVLSDEPLLQTLQAQLAANEYHVGTAVDLIVASRQFREIRGRDHEPDHE